MEFMEDKWLYVVMVVAAFVMLWAQGQSKKFKTAWARPVVILSTLVIVALAATQLFQSVTAPQRQGDKIRNKELFFLSSALQTLGEEIGTNHRGANILLITRQPSQFDKLQERQDVVKNGLKLGLRDRAKVGAIVHPAPPEGITDVIDDSMVTAKMIDELIANNPGHQIVLLMIDMPHDFQDMALWSMPEDENRPKLAFAVQSVYELRRAIAAEFIAAAVTYRPGYKFDLKSKAPELYTDAFTERYLLVTPANVDALAEEYPKLFLVEEEEDDK
jgi:hypothetical protein